MAELEEADERITKFRERQTQKERRSLFPAKYSSLDILFFPSTIVMVMVMGIADFDDFMKCF